MSDRKLAKAVQILFRQIRQLYRALTKGLVTWLLRTALLINRRNRRATAGFVLPTTVLLILVVSLTAGALTYRAFSNSNRVIGETQNRIIYNAATPAVDRARAKMEYLFDPNRESRFPGGVPSESLLMALMLNDGSNIRGSQPSPLPPDAATNPSKDPYTLPDEERIDVSNPPDGKKDNAWKFEADTDGNGQPDATVVYSIVFATPPDNTTATPAVPGWQTLISLTDQQKADGQAETGSGGRVISYTRGGPLSNATGKSCTGASIGTSVERGWYQDLNNSATLRKNFQVDAFVLPHTVRDGAPGNFSTLEFQQDRKLDRGNKWGAWFRNDLEIFPGAPFRWNGAMHSEGSIVMGGNGSTNFNAYLISSSASCLFDEGSASEITVAQRTNDDGSIFKGVVSGGTLVYDSAADGSANIHLPYPHPNQVAGGIQNLSNTTDWSTTDQPYQVSSDPAAIVSSNAYKARGSDPTNQTFFNNANNVFTGRVRVDSDSKPPYVDDTYRADNRYGPKLKYNDQPEARIPTGSNVGDVIPSSNTLLVGDTPPAGAEASTVGLDGYWERRARNEGLRILVGQRLELGNLNGWVAPQDRPNAAAQDLAATSLTDGDGDPSTLRKTDYSAATDATTADPDKSDLEGDPLYSTYKTLDHEAIQRRALRDNISAVQATAVYHAAVSKDYPIACLASTAHPGNPFTLAQSINFVPTTLIDSSTGAITDTTAPTTRTALLTDFFNGRGTNGWEFEPPMGDQSTFIAGLAAGQPLRQALDNLANFAGDPDGAFPPKQEAGQVHPDPELSMWGNFSNLRRTLRQVDTGGYNSLSPADKTYLQTAACTLGMLAYNIDQVQRFDPRNPAAGQGDVMADLGSLLYEFVDGINDPANNNYEVLPRTRLNTYSYNGDPTKSAVQKNYNVRDYDRVPPEAYVATLIRKLSERQNLPPTDPKITNDPKVRLAELIMTHFQVRRDRTYGFRPSPAANTWNYNPYVATGTGSITSLWSSACDPNIFALNSPGLGQDKKAVLATDIDTSGNLTAAAATKVASPDTSDVDNARARLGLSRLCGAVIPPGAVHDYPGDRNYPARKNNANADYLPKTGGNLLTGGAGVYGSTGDIDPSSGTDVFNTTGNSINTAPFDGEIYKRASVAPKWPALYYLFPEVTHGQKGGVTAKSGTTVLDVVDHRQPGAGEGSKGELAHVNPATGAVDTSKIMPAAFQPWAEPYVKDAYINGINTATDLYKPIDATTIMQPAEQSYTVPTPIPFTDNSSQGNPQNATYTYKTFGFPIADYSLSAIALRPRKLPTASTAGVGAGFSNPSSLPTGLQDWKLPVGQLNGIPTRDSSNPSKNVSPNLLSVPNGDNATNPTIAAVPFLDRVLFDGRQWQPTRVLDIDLGMLRRTQPTGQVSGNTETAPNDVWLPVSGIVYAFREDAVREDAINRPPGSATCVDAPVVGSNLGCTDARNPASPVDPKLAPQNVSVKSVDFVIDPERRPHGFRLRNGSQLKRHSSLGLQDNVNIRGISFFTDNPVYIMGSYNLHQDGSEDTAGTRLEEFKTLLPDNFTEDDFYNRTDTDYPDFANSTVDRWRPSEILADAITVVSENLCDGSMLDTFTTAGLGSKYGSGVAVSYGSVYQGNAKYPLFGSNCTNGGLTTFLNQNRPKNTLQTNWAWLSENIGDSQVSDPTKQISPIKISRSGSGVMMPPPPTAPTLPAGNAGTLSPDQMALAQRPQVYQDYSSVKTDYYDIRNTDDERPPQDAQDTRLNSIIINGITPSRKYQSYGGLHNFPRLLETWRPAGARLWFSGSFIQINFSNYATAPYDQDALEPGQAVDSGTDKNKYYQPPQRLWGYDVALQLSPAGPAASRFVTQTKARNEFYNEPPANDPYIKNLCNGLRSNLGAAAKFNCPA